MSFLSPEQLRAIGIRSFGDDVRVSTKASIYGAPHITLGSHVRIDDFCVLSAGEAGFTFGNYIHIGVHGCIIGRGAVVIDDFANVSGRVSVYSQTDDFSGEMMTNPMVPELFTNVTQGAVHIGRHVIIGSGTVILPSVSIGEGATIGALSLIKSDCSPFGIYAGVPARLVGERKRSLLEVERRFLRAQADSPTSSGTR